MTADEKTLADFMPGAGPVEEGVVARAGQPRPDDASPPSKEALVEAFKEIHDPEIPVNIYDLGLIYDIEIESAGKVRILMTLTAPNCPVAGILPQQVAEAAAAVDNVGEVVVTLTWSPAWTKDRMSDDAKFALDMF
jgi:FeS assembly SUF system protein